MTSAANALGENKRSEKLQQNSYGSVQGPSNNQALIKEVTNRYEALAAVLLEIQVFSAMMLCCWISVFSVFLLNTVPSSSGSGSPQRVAVPSRLLDPEGAGDMFREECWEQRAQDCSVTYSKTCILWLLTVTKNCCTLQQTLLVDGSIRGFAYVQNYYVSPYGSWCRSLAYVHLCWNDM